MKKNLVIVESPAKAKTLKNYLGEDFDIEASVGHIKDLPVNRLAVDIDNDFEPEYQVLKGKEKVIDAIVKKAKNAKKIFLASDPDREGEAIAWHISEEIGDYGNNKTLRAIFHEITKDAILKSINSPMELNKNLYEAQRARRVLDRLVGYLISPILWKKVKKGLSAGRVQSVAVRLISEREKEIRNFKPEEYWNIYAAVNADTPPPFRMKLTEVLPKKETVSNRTFADAILKDLEDAEFKVSGVEKKQLSRNPAPPFITSTLQQEAARKLRFPTAKTMMIAQRLYEGVELGEKGAMGLITYMRTDSTRVSNEAIGKVREYIENKFTKEYLAPKTRVYKNKKSAQDAHEAIRPTTMTLTPEDVKPYLDRNHYLLYQLIWNRFVASQMASAEIDQTKIESLVKDKYLFTAIGQVVNFKGFLAIYEEGADEEMPDEDSQKMPLPQVSKGAKLTLKEITSEQKFTLPPPRFSESSLVKELEKRGIGRPSTYANIVSVIQEKSYVAKDPKGKFYPSELGELVTDLLIENFPEILDIKFTAKMEESLDEVEEGKAESKQILNIFYKVFKKRLDEASTNMRNIKMELKETGIICEKCGANMVIRWGKKGKFLACPNFPVCKNTKEFVNGENGDIKIVEKKESKETCEKCGKEMVIKVGKKGRFMACSGYPVCKNSRPIPTGVKCPNPKCSGMLIERQSKKGKTFFACSMYPDCNYTLWDMPIPEKCPNCNAPFLTISRKSGVEIIKCVNKDCCFESTPEEFHEMSNRPAETPAED